MNYRKSPDLSVQFALTPGL